MTPEQLERLRVHAVQLCLALIREANRDGLVRVSAPDGTVFPDPAATHHLAEVLVELDREIFSDGIEAAVAWFAKPENGLRTHPFALDSIVNAAPESEGLARLLEEVVASAQLANGALPVFTGYLRGGDYFSTLWATRILCRYSPEAFKATIARAVDYLVTNRVLITSKPTEIGFLGLLLASARPNETSLLQELGAETAAALRRRTMGEPSGLAVDVLFLIEDLLAMSAVSPNAEWNGVVDDALTVLFELHLDAKRLPTFLARARESSSDSLFLETLARAAIVGVRRCRGAGIERLALTVNRLVHNDYRDVRYTALKTGANLRAFLERYGAIHESFAVHNETLEEIWKTSEFASSIFLMMPFRETLAYRNLTEVIRATCAKHGFRAIRVDDVDRRFSNLLWENLVVNMLSCKFAIAVHVSEHVVDKVRQDEVRLFPNPNVALEFGFFKSRGQEVLLLKDRRANLPTDLQGFLWQEFDIENPDLSVPGPLETWLAQIAASDPSAVHADATQ